MSYQDKSLCITARYGGACFEHDLKHHARTHVAEPLGCALRTWPRIKVAGGGIIE